MKNRTRIALAVSGLVAVALLATSGAAVADYLRTRSLIRVVKTVDDLRATRRIDLPGNVHVWLGVSATSAHVHGSVLVYALTEGYVPPGRSAGRDDRLGPLFVQDAREKTLEQSVKESWAAAGPHFFMRALSFASQGPHEVSVTAPGGTVVGKVTILVDGVEEAAFLELDDVTRCRTADDGELASCVATTRARAEPRIDGDRAFRVPADLLPSLEVPALRLSVDQGDLVVTSPHEDLWTRPVASSFAVRLWIGGVPVAAGDHERILRELTGRVETVHRLRLHLHLDQEARPGDRVLVQLLDLSDEPRVTNRVEYTVP